MYKNNNVLVGKNVNNYVNVLLKQNKNLKIKKINSSNFFFTFINYIYVNIIEPNLALFIILSIVFLFLLYRYNKKIKKSKKIKKNKKNIDIDPFENTSLNLTPIHDYIGYNDYSYNNNDYVNNDYINNNNNFEISEQ